MCLCGHFKELKQRWVSKVGGWYDNNDDGVCARVVEKLMWVHGDGLGDKWLV